MTRALGTIRRHGKIIAALRPGTQFELCLSTAPAGRSAHRLHTEGPKHSREQRPVLAGADERRQMLVVVIRTDEALVNLHAQAQPVVPEGEDDEFIRETDGTASTFNL